VSLALHRGTGGEAEAVFPVATPSAGLAEFLSRLKHREKPRLYDVGPAPGGNIVFFAGKGLRVYVDADRDHRLAGSAPDLLHLGEQEFEAALLWDLIDFLPRDRAEPFIAGLARAMKPGGMVYLLSSTSRLETPGPVHTYFVQTDGRISTRAIDGALAKRIRRENRELITLFASFENVSLHLLRSGMREILLKRR
jgi:hypothetical protein